MKNVFSITVQSLIFLIFLFPRVALAVERIVEVEPNNSRGEAMEISDHLSVTGTLEFGVDNSDWFVSVAYSDYPDYSFDFLYDTSVCTLDYDIYFEKQLTTADPDRTQESLLPPEGLKLFINVFITEGEGEYEIFWRSWYPDEVDCAFGAGCY